MFWYQERQQSWFCHGLYNWTVTKYKKYLLSLELFIIPVLDGGFLVAFLPPRTSYLSFEQPGLV